MNPTHTPPPAANYDNAAGGFRLTEKLPYAYLEFCGVAVVRFGGAEVDDSGQPLYPGRMAFLRGDTYYYLRTRGDGSVYLDPAEGD